MVNVHDPRQVALAALKKKLVGDQPKEKFVQMIHTSPKGEIFSCLLDNDGRPD